MSYIYNVKRKTLCSTQRLSKVLRDSPVDYKAPLTGSYTVILTARDMYATDVLILILIIVSDIGTSVVICNVGDERATAL